MASPQRPASPIGRLAHGLLHKLSCASPRGAGEGEEVVKKPKVRAPAPALSSARCHRQPRTACSLDF